MKLAYSNTSFNSMNEPKAKVITITSGKGGVGKSSTATNLALSLAALDKKVCVFDADASLANINILLGIQPTHTLQHLLNGEKELKDIIIDGPRGLKIVPGATGIAEYAHLSNEQKEILLTALDKLQEDFDYLIIDTAAGIGDDVLDFIKASQFSIIIITPEPTSLTDSFSLLKALKRSNYNRTSYVLVNMALDFDNSQAIYKRFESAVKKYIDADIAYLGYIQVDETMISSVSLQCPAVLLSPDSVASNCFKNLATGLNKDIENSPIDSFADFWRQQGSIVGITVKKPTEAANNVFINKTQSTELPIPHATTPIDFQQALEVCIKHLSSSEVTEEDSATFLNAIAPFQAVKAKDTAEPSSTSTTSAVRQFYKYLEQHSFPKNDIREVVSTLEQAYFEKHGESLNSIDSTTLKLFSQFSGSEDDLRYVNEQLSNNFQRLFDKPLHDIIEETQHFCSSDDFQQQEFDTLLTELLSSYQQRFATHFKTEADAHLDSAKEEISTLQKQVSDTNQELSSTTNLLTEKTLLIEKIQALFPKG